MLYDEHVMACPFCGRSVCMCRRLYVCMRDGRSIDVLCCFTSSRKRCPPRKIHSKPHRRERKAAAGYPVAFSTQTPTPSRNLIKLYLVHNLRLTADRFIERTIQQVGPTSSRPHHQLDSSSTRSAAGPPKLPVTTRTMNNSEPF